LFFSDFGGDLGAAVTEGRRREFAAWPAFSDDAARGRIPDPQDPATMRASTLRWEERAREPHDAILALHRELLALRRDAIVPHLASEAHGEGYEVLGPGALRVAWRFGDGARLELLANLSARPVRAAVSPAGARLFTIGALETDAGDAVLGPWSAAWFLRS
jgi:1,4-alpha-glucan branching enzyme